MELEDSKKPAYSHSANKWKDGNLATDPTPINFRPHAHLIQDKAKEVLITSTPSSAAAANTYVQILTNPSMLASRHAHI